MTTFSPDTLVTIPPSLFPSLPPPDDSLGSESFLSSLLNVLDKIKSHNPQVRYVCDPVLGDNGKYYVPPALVDIFRTTVIPRSVSLLVFSHTPAPPLIRTLPSSQSLHDHSKPIRS
jgi:hypothetical protein